MRVSIAFYYFFKWFKITLKIEKKFLSLKRSLFNVSNVEAV